MYLRPSNVDRSKDSESTSLTGIVKRVFSRFLPSFMTKEREVVPDSVIQELDEIPPIDESVQISFQQEEQPERLYPSPKQSNYPTPGSDPNVQLLLKQQEQIRKQQEEIENMKRGMEDMRTQFQNQLQQQPVQRVHQAEREQSPPQIAPPAKHQMANTIGVINSVFRRSNRDVERGQGPLPRETSQAEESAFSFTKPPHRVNIPQPTTQQEIIPPKQQQQPTYLHPTPKRASTIMSPRSKSTSRSLLGTPQSKKRVRVESPDQSMNDSMVSVSSSVSQSTTPGAKRIRGPDRKSVV